MPDVSPCSRGGVRDARFVRTFRAASPRDAPLAPGASSVLLVPVPRRRVLLAAAATVALLLGLLAMRERLLETLLFFPEALPPVTPADAGLRYEELSIPTEDGQTLHAWWLPAAPPVFGHVLHLHGNAGSIAYRIDTAGALLGAGLDVLLFDYRGYGRSTGRPTEAGTLLDARAARLALLARRGVRPDRVVYLGESLGGAVAVALAAESPPRALVLQSTFTSVREMAALHYPLVPSFLVPDAYPSLRRAGSLSCPVLVIHGERDDIAPLAHGVALHRAARSGRLEVVPGAAHNDLVEALGPRLGRLVADFLRQAEAGTPGPRP